MMIKTVAALSLCVVVAVYAEQGAKDCVLPSDLNAKISANDKTGEGRSGIIAEYLAKSAEERAAILADPVQKAKFRNVTPRPEDGPPRFMAVDSVPNMRDIGGWIGLGGRRVRHGLVYRSAAFDTGAQFKRGEKRGYEYIFGLTPVAEEEKSDFKPSERTISDKGIAELVQGLGIRSDLDLRSPHECYGMTGSPLGPGVKWFHCPQKTYAGFKDEDAKRAFAAAFRVFLDKSNYPVVFHCAGGADRTGAVAFMINGVLGVSLDDLSRDWELTAFGTAYASTPDFTHEKRFNKLVAVVDAFPGATLTDRIVSYVKSCGFTDADIAYVREILLEPIPFRQHSNGREKTK
jgi:protein-tyrosine phosphatase